MCVAAVAWNAHPDWLLVAVGNRDEFHHRPAAPLARWSDPAGLIAGKDLLGGGTWLGVSEASRFVLVTNYRVPEGSQPGRPSRGKLVTDLLTAREPEPLGSMNAFNLIQADHSDAWFITNYPETQSRRLAPGIHGLSNGGFDVPWAKTLKLQAALQDWLDRGDADIAPLLATMRDETPLPAAPDAKDAPDPRMSPIFIRNEAYGTRCSTVVAISRYGHGMIHERSFSADGTETGNVRLDFRWDLA
jgi:uncharacterized protein with NRDE domain